MDNIVCVDTQILIWGIRNESIPDQVEMIEKAKRLFNHLDEIHSKIIIPAPALSEYLVPADKGKHLAILESFNKNFIVAPHDAKSAAIAAELYKDNNCKEIKDCHEFFVTRNHLKIDCMIVAIAIARNALEIFSNDQGVLKLANGKIKASRIPDIPIQMAFLD